MNKITFLLLALAQVSDICPIEFSRDQNVRADFRYPARGQLSRWSTHEQFGRQMTATVRSVATTTVSLPSTPFRLPPTLVPAAQPRTIYETFRMSWVLLRSVLRKTRSTAELRLLLVRLFGRWRVSLSHEHQALLTSIPLAKNGHTSEISYCVGMIDAAGHHSVVGTTHGPTHLPSHFLSRPKPVPRNSVVGRRRPENWFLLNSHSVGSCIDASGGRNMDIVRAHILSCDFDRSSQRMRDICSFS